MLSMNICSSNLLAFFLHAFLYRSGSSETSSIAFFNDSGCASTKKPVWPLITVSFSAPSFTPTTAFPLACASTGTKPKSSSMGVYTVSYTHLRAHETPEHLVCRLLLEKKKKNQTPCNLPTTPSHQTNQPTQTSPKA